MGQILVIQTIADVRRRHVARNILRRLQESGLLEDGSLSKDNRHFIAQALEKADADPASALSSIVAEVPSLAAAIRQALALRDCIEADQMEVVAALAQAILRREL